LTRIDGGVSSVFEGVSLSKVLNTLCHYALSLLVIGRKQHFWYCDITAMLISLAERHQCRTAFTLLLSHTADRVSPTLHHLNCRKR